MRRGWAAIHHHLDLGWLAYLPICAGVLLLGWAIGIAWQPRPGVSVIDEGEAIGPQFSDPDTLDLVFDIHRKRACPSTTQRWVWHWVDYRGRRGKRAIPLDNTVMPFLEENGLLIITVPVRGVEDPSDNWFERSVTNEQCPLLPAYMPSWLATVFHTNNVFRSVDHPVNFVGAPTVPNTRPIPAR